MFYSIIQHRDRDQSIQNEHDAELEEARREADSFSFGPRHKFTNTRLESAMPEQIKVESDCEDQGFTRISDGCQSCVIWKDNVRVKADIAAVDGVYRCVNCGGCYGLTAGSQQ